MYRILGAIAAFIGLIAIIILLLFPATLFDSPMFGLWNNVFGGHGKGDTVACTFPLTGKTVDLNKEICEATGGLANGRQEATVPINPTPVPVNPTQTYACPNGQIVSNPDSCVNPTPIPVGAPPAVVPVNLTPVSNSSNACQPGDKIGTWSEGNNPYRIEVGGHGIQHLDFYPSQGVKSISYLVTPGIADPDGVPDLAWGYGSMWEWNPPGCNYDLLADETAYAQARLDSGHSGLVVEWGTWEIKANVTGMSQSDAEALISQHRASFGKSDADQPTASTQQVNPAPETNASCGNATRIGDADNQTVTVPSGHTYIVDAWEPRTELMAFSEGQTISGVKGALWDYACGIDTAIAAEQAQGKNPVRQ